MAKTKGVWGIDIGQSALKALRCVRDDDGNIVAESYDFIEYPKALSLPDADEEALVVEAMETFLGRNEVRGDFVGMTVSGQAGLSRFFKPPPVDAKTLPEIVKYEVRQQIPFPIEDVIWDWQSMGGTEMDGVLVDAEVGLFAIKRDTIYAALQPFLKKDIEVELVQLSPLASQNVICHELMEDLPEGEEVDVESLPDSLVVLSMGTDSTDLIVTNGVKLWLRNIPIGGNHFTKELSRELKLTHAKAEHLKRNARQAEDPKTVFQAMRRVFNDLKKEIDRSLSFYSGMDKHASLDKIVLLGNAARLPGLRQYLNKQLEMDIAKVTSFQRIKGPVTEERVFRENVLSFAPVYGLCLQGLNKARVDTNLLPVEFVNERIVRAKKPWALASVSLLLLGMLFSYFFANQKYWGVHEDYSSGGVKWSEATAAVEQKASLSSRFVTEFEEQTTLLNQINAISAELSEASETQAAWPEFLSALDQLLPRDPRLVNEDGTLNIVANPDEVPFEDREEIYIDHIETEYVEDIAFWLDKADESFKYQQEEKIDPTKKKKRGVVDYDIEGDGFIVEIQGHHFFNSSERVDKSEQGQDFVIKRFLSQLVSGEFQLLNANGEKTTYKPSDIGIYRPTLASDFEVAESNEIANPNFGRESASNKDGDAGEDSEKEISKTLKAPRYDFVVQMVFQPESPEGRDEARTARLEEEKKAAAEAAKNAGKEEPAESAPASGSDEPQNTSEQKSESGKQSPEAKEDNGAQQSPPAENENTKPPETPQNGV